MLDEHYGEWGHKGATLSDKTARKEYGLSQEDIIDAIRAGKLQCREGSMHGNPWLRLLRREVEALVRERSGGGYLKARQVKTELAHIESELWALKKEIARLEERKAELKATGPLLVVRRRRRSRTVARNVALRRRFVEGRWLVVAWSATACCTGKPLLFPRRTSGKRRKGGSPVKTPAHCGKDAYQSPPASAADGARLPATTSRVLIGPKWICAPVALPGTAWPNAK